MCAGGIVKLLLRTSAVMPTPEQLCIWDPVGPKLLPSLNQMPEHSCVPSAASQHKPNHLTANNDSSIYCRAAVFPKNATHDGPHGVEA